MADVGLLTAASIQAASTAVLVGVTIYYAKRTNRIANAAEDQAEAAQQAVEESTRATRLGVRPILILGEVDRARDEDGRQMLLRKYEREEREKTGNLPISFAVSIVNVGSGPAVDLFLHEWNPETEKCEEARYSHVAAGDRLEGVSLCPHMAPVIEGLKRGTVPALFVEYGDMFNFRRRTMRRLEVPDLTSQVPVSRVRPHEFDDLDDIR